MAKIVVPRLCLRLQQQLKELAPYLIGIGVNTLLKPNVGSPSFPAPALPPPPTPGLEQAMLVHPLLFL